MRIITNTPDELLLRETPWSNIIYGSAMFLCCSIAFAFLKSQSYALIFLIFAVVGVGWCLGLSRSALFHFDGKTSQVRIRIRSLLGNRDQTHPLALFKGIRLETKQFRTGSRGVGRKKTKMRAILQFRIVEDEPLNLLMGSPEKWTDIALEINRWHQLRGGEVDDFQNFRTGAFSAA